MRQRRAGFAVMALGAGSAALLVWMLARAPGPAAPVPEPAAVLRQVARAGLLAIAAAGLVIGAMLVITARLAPAAEAAPPTPGPRRGIGRLGPWVLVVAGGLLAAGYPLYLGWQAERAAALLPAGFPDSGLRLVYWIGIGQIEIVALAMLVLGAVLLRRARRDAGG